MMCFIAEVCFDDFYARDNLLVMLLKAGLWLFHILVQVVLLPSSASKLEVNDRRNTFFPLFTPCTKRPEVVFQL